MIIYICIYICHNVIINCYILRLSERLVKLKEKKLDAYLFLNLNLFKHNYTELDASI